LEGRNKRADSQGESALLPFQNQEIKYFDFLTKFAVFGLKSIDKEK
jgi:hypothetical protein